MADPLVYLIDDDRAVLQSAEAVLAPLEYPIECYLSAEAFLAEARLRASGCVVTDLRMPGMNGIELSCRLTEFRSPLAIVVLTGGGFDAETERVLAESGTAILEKPYHYLDLWNVVRSGMEASVRRCRDAPGGTGDEHEGRGDSGLSR